MAESGGERARLAQTVTTYRTALIALGVAAVGGLTLWLITWARWFDQHTTTTVVLEQLSGLLITTGGLAILWDLRGKRDIIQEVLA